MTFFVPQHDIYNKMFCAHFFCHQTAYICKIPKWQRDNHLFTISSLTVFISSVLSVHLSVILSISCINLFIYTSVNEMLICIPKNHMHDSVYITYCYIYFNIYLPIDSSVCLYPPIYLFQYLYIFHCLLRRLFCFGDYYSILKCCCRLLSLSPIFCRPRQYFCWQTLWRYENCDGWIRGEVESFRHRMDTWNFNINDGWKGSKEK